MEDFFDFLPALLILWVVVRALRGARRRRPPQRASLTPGAGVPAAPAAGFTGFEDLVRRLEDAAAEAARRNEAGVTARAAPPALTPARGTLESRRDEEETFKVMDAAEAAGRFRFVGAPDEPIQETEFHETHPLALKPMPGLAMPSLDMPSIHLGEIGSPRPVPVHPLVTRLRTVATAREALLLKDVLGPPRAHRQHP